MIYYPRVSPRDSAYFRAQSFPCNDCDEDDDKDNDMSLTYRSTASTLHHQCSLTRELDGLTGRNAEG